MSNTGYALAVNCTACVKYITCTKVGNDGRYLKICNDFLKKEVDDIPKIKDSGERQEFGTGAVRDMAEGKGRCDLMPLGVISEIYARYLPESPDIANIFAQLEKFKNDGDISHLQSALWSFIDYKDWGGWCNMLLDVALHFEAGAKKYGPHNWQKGIPVHSYIDSAVRHFLKYLRGDMDEPHDRAFCWNILCCIWTVENKPEMDDFTDVHKNLSEN